MTDGICQDCLLPNPTWFATNALWNAVTEHWTEPEFPGRARTICPSCFIGLAESQGMVPTAWILTPEMPSRKWTHEQRPPAPAPELCGLCGDPAKGYALIGDQRYCHGDDETYSCYMQMSQAPADEVGGPMSAWSPTPDEMRWGGAT